MSDDAYDVLIKMENDSPVIKSSRYKLDKSLKGVIKIEEGITCIGNYAFSGCFGITKVILPSTIEAIGDHTFEACKNLEEIALPEGLFYIGNSAFSDCNKLAAITIPNTVLSISEHAFNDCNNLISVTIGAGVKRVENGAFFKCVNLSTMTFSQNEGLDGVVEGVVVIKENAFGGCSSLHTINFPDSLEEIEGKAFTGCIDLMYVVIPESTEVSVVETFDSHTTVARRRISAGTPS